MPGELLDIQKSVVFRDNLLVLSSQSGLFIYKIGKEDGSLFLAQKFTFPSEIYYTDMQID